MTSETYPWSFVTQIFIRFCHCKQFLSCVYLDYRTL